MADFSCYITIYNNTPYTLTLTDSGDPWGYWNIAPPKTIQPFQATTQFQLEDKAGPGGTEGYVTYTANSPAADVFTMKFSDPYSGSNYCNINNPNGNSYGVFFVANSGSGDNNNVCPTSGHPLTISYYLKSFV